MKKYSLKSSVAKLYFPIEAEKQLEDVIGTNTKARLVSYNGKLLQEHSNVNLEEIDKKRSKLLLNEVFIPVQDKVDLRVEMKQKQPSSSSSSTTTITTSSGFRLSSFWKSHKLKDAPVEHNTFPEVSVTEPAIKICIKATCKTFDIDCFPTSTIEDVKQSIFLKDGIPPDQQLLIFRGSHLQDERDIQDYHITDQSTIQLIMRLRGGMHHITSGRVDFHAVNYCSTTTPSATTDPKKGLKAVKLNVDYYDEVWPLYSYLLVHILIVGGIPNRNPSLRRCFRCILTPSVSYLSFKA
eukprot:TRINITY_DN4506_c0_g1_i2.p1 TRINITY_DN4506_c0_g1~~TRINITY_DN4506_c0_g1_i2.p1  ORF type:complete len:295 (-),score=50.16 TRINITY_DN4506_c0_g1_i2:313-1197(-)